MPGVGWLKGGEGEKDPHTAGGLFWCVLDVLGHQRPGKGTRKGGGLETGALGVDQGTRPHCCRKEVPGCRTDVGERGIMLCMFAKRLSNVLVNRALVKLE